MIATVKKLTMNESNVTITLQASAVNAATLEKLSSNLGIECDISFNPVTRPLPLK